MERETGTKMKETRKYVFQSLSELNRITLPGNKDHDGSGVIGQMDRSGICLLPLQSTPY